MVKTNCENVRGKMKDQICKRCLTTKMEEMHWYGEDECPKYAECVRWQRAGMSLPKDPFLKGE